MPILIPRFCENPTFRNELEVLLYNLTGTKELNIPSESIPQVLDIISEVLSTVENRYISLITLLNNKLSKENLELKDSLIELKENSIMKYKFSAN